MAYTKEDTLAFCRELYAEYKRRKPTGATMKLIAEERQLPQHTVRGKIGAAKREEKVLAGGNGTEPRPDLFNIVIGGGKAIELEGDAVIVGDIQAPTTDYWFAQLPGMIAKKHLKKGNRLLIIAGDLLNLDAFSGYDPTGEEVSFSTEKAAVKHLFKEFLEVFDRIVIIAGNHERRISRKTKGAISITDLIAILSYGVKGADRIEVSEWGHCIIKSGGETYRVTHGKNYSVNQLTVGDVLAQKFQQHIISHHEHHVAKGWDRFKRYIVVNNGGLFDPDQMAYVKLDDGKNPNMQIGFTLLKGGYAHLLAPEPYTDWERWLPEPKTRKQNGKGK